MEGLSRSSPSSVHYQQRLWYELSIGCNAMYTPLQLDQRAVRHGFAQQCALHRMWLGADQVHL